MTPANRYTGFAVARPRTTAELITNDRSALRERLEAAASERIAALEGGEPERTIPRKPGAKAARGHPGRQYEGSAGADAGKDPRAV